MTDPQPFQNPNATQTPPFTFPQQQGPGSAPFTAAAATPAKASWFRRHKILTGVGVFWIVAGIGGAIAGGGSSGKPSTSAAVSSSKPATTGNSAPAKANPAQPAAAAPTSQQIADKAAKSVNGGHVNTYGAKLDVTFAIQDNFTSGMVRGGIAMDAFKMADAFKKSGLTFTTLTIHGTADMTDSYGEVTKAEPVFVVVLDYATVQRIQYDNIDETSLDLLNQLANSIYLQQSFGWTPKD